MVSAERKIGQPAWQCAAEIPPRVHLVGVGGIGMSAIAHVLATWGHTVTGSDIGANTLTQALNRQGIRTYVGHAAEQIGEADWVVASSAVPATNVELEAARRRGIPVLKRQQLLGHMMAGRVGIGVAGTHGKTTTTAIIAAMLTEAGCDPTYIVGGVLQQTESNARAGHGPHFLVEADEYDRMFLGLRPRIAVLTHLEMDHPDCYPTMDEMRAAYVQFLRLVPAEGCIVACSDSAEVERVLTRLPDTGRPRIVRYGLASTADCVVGAPTANACGGVDFRLTGVAGLGGAYHTRIPGVHNALNAAAALIVAREAGAQPGAAAEALARFSGVRRRFEVLGERAGVLVVDDYAHHPTEIRATLAAARLRYPERRLVAVWQPHTYSRVRTLLDEFATCFADADRVVMTDVYAARASEVEPIDARLLCDVVRHAQVRYAGGIDATVADLLADAQSGDLVLVLGAGDSALIGQRLLVELAQREAAVHAEDQRER